jgi:hypothetical protein
MIKFFLIIIATFSSIVSQTYPTIAILDLENKALLKDITMQRVDNKFLNELSAKGDFIIFVPDMIDTILSSQGNKNILNCRYESCLFQIGHLLNVDFVLNGSITKQNRRFFISIEMIDIKNNVAVGSTDGIVADFYDSTLQKTIPAMVTQLFGKKETKVIKSIHLHTKQTDTTEQNIEKTPVMYSTKKEKKKKNKLSKSILWIPVSAVIISGTVAAVYYFKFKHNNNTNGNLSDDEISTDDAPQHP